MKIDLTDEVAIVTGGRTGIGQAIALAFAKAGANLVIPTHSDLDDCKRIVGQIEKMGKRALAVLMDVTNRKEIERMVRQVIDEFGKIDILVNNAGIAVLKPLIDFSEEEYDKILNINLKGYFLCSQAVAQIMMKGKKGKIINIASVAGHIGLREHGPYTASKGGVIQLTKTLALELAPYSINVNAISPGPVETNMTKDLYSDPTVRRKILETIPLQRIGIPSDIANAAVFLASELADYITGTTLIVDGGWLAGYRWLPSF